jgi:hypothetical protein
MGSMKLYLRAVPLATSLLLALTFQSAVPGTAAAGQSTQAGAIEFVARVAPTDGVPEPVRAQTFYLLRRSLADIRNEIEAQDPAPKLNDFIDGLSVSPELKAWMKQNKTVELAGSGFIKKLNVDSVMGVPEFYTAYMTRNTGYPHSGFPVPKYTEKIKQKDPEKFKLLVQEYHDAVYHYCKENPDSMQGMEAEMTDVNPSQAWEHLKDAQKHRVENKVLRLAQSDFLAAQTDSDLDGRGAIINVPPGDYWLSTLNILAQAGDVRLAWDAHVTVRAGETTQVELNNLNAALQEPQQ